MDRGVGSAPGLLGGVVGDNLLSTGVMDFSTYGQRHYGIDYDQRHLGSSDVSRDHIPRALSSSDFSRDVRLPVNQQSFASSDFPSGTGHLDHVHLESSVRDNSRFQHGGLDDVIRTGQQNVIDFPSSSTNSLSNCAYYDIPAECASSYNDVRHVYKYTYSVFTGKCHVIGVCQSCVDVAGLRFNLFDDFYSCHQSCVL